MTTETDSTPDAGLLCGEASSARLIVCERQGDWAVALRHELEAAGPRVHETRSVAECWNMLAGWPASFVVAELTRSSAKVLLERMAWLERDFPWARVAVVAERSLAWSEWQVRGAGAAHFTVSPRQLGPLASLAVRHLAAAPQPHLSLAERIWADLPWKRVEDEG